jgi:hypothetical protein
MWEDDEVVPRPKRIFGAKWLAEAESEMLTKNARI